MAILHAKASQKNAGVIDDNAKAAENAQKANAEKTNAEQDRNVVNPGTSKGKNNINNSVPPTPKKKDGGKKKATKQTEK